MKRAIYEKKYPAAEATGRNVKAANQGQRLIQREGESYQLCKLAANVEENIIDR